MGESHSKKAAPKSFPLESLCDLEKNEKRWLLVGISLHTFISPILRTYITPRLNHLWQTLISTHHIHTQQYKNQLETYSSQFLNYEAINNNKVHGMRQQSRFDYTVKDPVALSKLFLQTNMAQYTGFNTCDISALLGIVINTGICPPSGKLCAEKVRSEIRNQWAHCNFTEWDDTKYRDSVKLIKQLVGSLSLSTEEEDEILSQLKSWKKNGKVFIEETTPESDVIKDISKQFKDMVEQNLEKDIQEKIRELTEKMDTKTGKMEHVCCTTKRMKKILYDLSIIIEYQLKRYEAAWKRMLWKKWVFENRYRFTSKTRTGVRLVFLTVLLNTCTVEGNDVNIKWTLGRIPSEFGGNVYLNCTITDGANSCNNSLRQWIGGSFYKRLCRNDKCNNTDKYEIMYNSNKCIYTLMIKHFWELDGNCDYTCLYGVKNDRKSLVVNTKSFVYKPVKNDTNVTTSESSGKISASIYIPMVYPKPRCILLLSGYNDIQQFPEGRMTCQKENKGSLFHNVTLNGTFKVSVCPADYEIFCTVGNISITLYSGRIDKCEEKNAQVPTIWLKVVVITTILAMIVFTGCFLKWKYKKCLLAKRTNENDQLQGKLDRNQTICKEELVMLSEAT